MIDSTVSVILAAGLGTRMRSRQAKVLHGIAGYSLIEWVLRALRGGGIAQHVVVVGHQADLVQKVAAGPGVRFVMQEQQNGTGHAVQCAEPRLPLGDEPVLVTVGDAPLVRAATYQMLLDYHRQHAADATILTANLADPSGYGRIVRSSGGAVLGIVEHRDASPAELRIGEINSGIYAFRAAALRSALGSLGNQNAQGETYLTDTIAILVRQGATVHGIPTDDPDELLGINTREQLAQAGAVLIRRKLSALMDAGVTIESPGSTWIEERVEIGVDTVIEPFVHLAGTTSIGEGCRIGAGSVLHDVRVDDGTAIPPMTRRVSRLQEED